MEAEFVFDTILHTYVTQWKRVPLKREYKDERWGWLSPWVCSIIAPVHAGNRLIDVN